MATARFHGVEGNSTYGAENIYIDNIDPTIAYKGQRGGKGPTRNRWFVEDLNTRKETGPFPTLGAAYAWRHRENGTHTLPGETLTKVPAAPVPEPKPVDDLPLLKFKCPSCGHSLVGLVAAE